MSLLREAFWVLALGVIGGFAFFFTLGTVTPGEVIAVTAVVLALCGLWLRHGWDMRRHAASGPPDARDTHARERRGF
jgi:TRAP-type C4-dicarboxylate transport system permease large subunit